MKLETTCPMNFSLDEDHQPVLLIDGESIHHDTPIETTAGVLASSLAAFALAMLSIESAGQLASVADRVN